MKLLVAVSVSREWTETEFLQQMGTWRFPVGWQVRFGWFRQFTAAERHNVALGEAMYNYDRLLFMDTDQVYPSDYIEMMLEHKEPVVTALNVSRYYPYEFTTYNITGENNGVPTFESIIPPTDKKIFECDMTGTGSLMIDPSAIRDMKQPYFKDLFDDNGAVRLLCDDFYFAWKLNKAGIRVTVDQNIVVKHLAKIMVSAYNVGDMKKAWEKVNSGHGYWKDGKK